MPQVSQDALHAALETVIDPEIRKPVTELGMVGSVSSDDGGRVAVTILLTVAACPLKDTLTKDTTEALSKVEGVTAVDVTLGVMDDEQRAALKTRLRGGVQEREVPFARPGSLTRVYAVPVFLVFPVAFVLNRLGQHYDIDPTDPANAVLPTSVPSRYNRNVLSSWVTAA